MLTLSTIFRIGRCGPRHRACAVLCIMVACLALASATPLAAQRSGARIVSSPRDSVSGSSTNPLTLNDVFARVHAGHPLLRAASARIDAARSSRTTAGAFSNPVLQYQVENAPLPGRSSVPLDREVITTAMIPLEALYQRGPRVARADADIRATEAEARARGIQLSVDAARAFYRVALAQVTVDVTRDLAAWLDSVVTYNRVRVSEGIAAEADLLRAQLEQDRASAEASMQEAELARERATLASYLGAPPARNPGLVAMEQRPLSWSVPDLRDALAGSSTSLSALLDRLPPLIAARERVASAAAGVSVERRMVVRDLSATLGTKQTAGYTSLIAGVSLPLPLFTANRGSIARATAEQHVAEFELAAVERTAWADLTGAYEAARVLSDRATQLAAPVRGGQTATPALLLRADESRRIALGAYREGAVPLLSVLDAARVWGEVRLTFYRALYAQHESALALAAALGIDPQQLLNASIATPGVRP